MKANTNNIMKVVMKIVELGRHWPRALAQHAHKHTSKKKNRTTNKHKAPPDYFFI